MKARRRSAEIGLGVIKSPRHLTGMMIEPFGVALVFKPPPSLVNLDQHRIHDAIRQRLLTQRGETIPAGWVDVAAACEFVEIFENDPGVVKRLAILKDERRDFAERILLAQAVFRV